MIVGTKTCVMERMDISRLGQGDIDFILPQCQRELMKVKPSFQPDEFTWPIHWSALHYDAVLRGAHNVTTISHTPPPPPPMTLRHHSNAVAQDLQTVMVQGQQTVMVQDHQTSIIIIIIILVIIIIKWRKQQNDGEEGPTTFGDIENQISDIENQIPPRTLNTVNFCLCDGRGHDRVGMSSVWSLKQMCREKQ